MKFRDLFKFRELFEAIWSDLEDGARTMDPILDPDIEKILNEDPEGWEIHLNLLSQGKPGLLKYERYSLV